MLLKCGRAPVLKACRWNGFHRPILSVERVNGWRSIAKATTESLQLIEEEDLSRTEQEDKRQLSKFKGMKLRAALVDALAEAEISSLTEIQEKAIPAIRERKDVLIASHTGSGKTYAYLLPIVERLKSEEEAEGVMTPLRTKRPRVIVLGPTRELTDQILQVAKSLSHHAKFCSMVLNGGVRAKTQRRTLAVHQDLVVATPSKLLEHHGKGHMYFRDVQILVLDEADTMFDETFLPDVQKIVNILQNKKEHCQFILVAATATKNVRSMLKSTFPGLEIIQTSTLHKGVFGSVHNFVTLKPGQDKIRLLRDVLAADVKKATKVMVFCNTLSSCRCIEHDLQEHGIATICYHGEVPKSERKGIIDQFSGYENEGHVLVCTDLAARGLDIPGNVDHVINFDFPMNPVDYLHRTGRTARAGASGHITSLVTGKDRVLADRIKWSVQHDLPLDEISPNKRILPPSLRPKISDVRKAKGIAEKISFKGLRGAKRVEVMKKVAEETTKRRQSRRGINKDRPKQTQRKKDDRGRTLSKKP